MIIRLLLKIVAIALVIFSAGIAVAVDTTGTYYTNSEAYHGPIYTSPGGVETAGCYGLPDAGDNWRVYESAHYLVYSDVADSDTTRKLLADYAEEELVTIKSKLGVSDADLGIDTADASTKLHICSDGKGKGASGGKAGISMPALNGTNVDEFDRFYCNYGYRATVRHETVHVVNGIIANEVNLGDKTEVWFAEGLAVYLSDQSALSDTISLADYFTIKGFPNPITIKTRSSSDTWKNSDYYPAFALAVKYLFDTDTAERGGAANNLLTLRAMFLDLRGGQSFTVAFFEHFNKGGSPLAVATYQTDFQSLMTTYLTPLQTNATVTGVSGIKMAGIFKYRCDMIMGHGAVVTSGNFALNVSEWTDGEYPLCFATNLDPTIVGVGPGTVTVAAGRLTPTTYNVASWTSPMDQGSAEMYKIGSTTLIYTTVQKAYIGLSEGDTLQIQALVFTGNLLLDQEKSITLRGGYQCDFAANAGYTTIKDKLTIKSGRAIVDKIIIK